MRILCVPIILFAAYKNTNKHNMNYKNNSGDILHVDIHIVHDINILYDNDRGRRYNNVYVINIPRLRLNKQTHTRALSDNAALSSRPADR